MQIKEKWSKDEEGQLLTLDFGKNGKGISDELSIIGKRIEELSKDNCVYLHHESFIDTADDVYELKFVLIPISESEQPNPIMGKALTLGEKRCHIDFNPSSDDKIGTFKRMMANAIDYCNDELQNTEDGEAKRCFSIAMTELETAQMYGVKGIAKGLKK
jgi:hypothetical protein